VLRVSVLGAALVVAAAYSDSKSSNDEVAALDGNHYSQTNLAANNAAYKAQFTLPRHGERLGHRRSPEGRARALLGRRGW
jgi:hypothetical protein